MILPDVSCSQTEPSRIEEVLLLQGIGFADTKQKLPFGQLLTSADLAGQ
jgi:hypothetical protein